jgi:glutathione S-transferase
VARTRLLIHSVFLFLLPVVVAGFGLGVLSAALLVLLMLLWRWLVVLSGIVAPEKTPEIVLETIGASHFVEKVRWCMDRLEIDYVERQSGGTLGAYFTGRSVPQLRVRTGIVESVIGNSPEILRFLYGNYAGDDQVDVEFLAPTPERLELEKRLDRFGRMQQVWVYYHILEDRDLTLHVWGANSPRTTAWHKPALRLLFPLLKVLIQRSFRIDDGNYAKAVGYIEELLSDIDTRLADGRGSILGGDAINYTDIAFAALSGIWLRPDEYGGGAADDCRAERDEVPAPMQAEAQRWIEDFPRATAFIERLYAEERLITNRVKT